MRLPFFFSIYLNYNQPTQKCQNNIFYHIHKKLNISLGSLSCENVLELGLETLPCPFVLALITPLFEHLHYLILILATSVTVLFESIEILDHHLVFVICWLQVLYPQPQLLYLIIVLHCP